MQLSDKASRLLGGMISDAAAEGTARPVDAMIGAQLVSAAINAASDLRFWRNGGQHAPPPEAYVASLFVGLVR